MPVVVSIATEAFGPEYGGNRRTKIYLSSYNSLFFVTIYKTQNPN